MKSIGARKGVELCRRIVKRLAQDNGQSLVLVGLSTVALIGMAGLGVSVATVYQQKSALQNAVDAAALAGAQAEVGGLSPTGQSVLISQNDPGASGTVSPENPEFWKVDAVGSKVISGGFAALFGFHTFTIRARGVAEEFPGPFDYAVFQGSRNTNTPLVFDGSVSVQTVDSKANYPSNVFSNGTMTLTGTGVTIDGQAGAGATISENGQPNVTGTPPLLNNQPIVQMPNLNYPQLPSTSTGCVETSIGSDQCDGASLVILNIPAGQTLALTGTIKSSVMVTGGGSISVGSNTTVDGSLYTSGGGSISVISSGDVVTGDILAENNTSGTASTINIGNPTIGGAVIAVGGNIDITGNATSGSGKSVSVGAFSQNGLGGNITVAGGVNLTGVLYAPNGNVALGKSGGGGGDVSVTGSVVGYTDTLSGDVNVSYNPDTVAQSAFQQVILIQ